MLSFPNLDTLDEDIKVLSAQRRPLTVLIDGPSGSGKTTLAELISRAWSDPQQLYVLHMDDLYPGWGGLDEAALIVSTILYLRSQGEPARWQRYDWSSGQLAEWYVISPETPLLIEGCGSISSGAELISDVRIWCDAPVGIRQERALSRGGENFDQHWESWERQYLDFQGRHRPENIATHTFITKTDTLDI
jgi:uridine kinase